MRLPSFTAEAALYQHITVSQLNVLDEAPRAAVQAAIPSNCFRQCIASGADGCGPFCACHEAGRSPCPNLY